MINRVSARLARLSHWRLMGDTGSARSHRTGAMTAVEKRRYWTGRHEAAPVFALSEPDAQRLRCGAPRRREHEAVISVAGSIQVANSTATARLSLSAIGVITALSVVLAFGDASRFNERRRLSRPDPRSPLDQDLWRRLAFNVRPAATHGADQAVS
jgi:hypothetical protein